MGRILFVDDEEAQRILFRQHFGESHTISEAGSLASATDILQTRQVDVLVADLVLGDESGWTLIERAREIEPHLPVIVVSAQESFETARRALTIGAIEFFPKAWHDSVEVERLRCALHRGEEIAISRRDVEAARARNSRHVGNLCELLGTSEAIRAVEGTIARYSDSDMPVLIEGPTGAGKEVVSRAIHLRSRFADGPFVVMNVPALSPSLLASELFGYVRGAFTGADRDYAGAFEQANHGTILLDEIGDVPLEAQPLLLRVFETKSVVRVGSQKVIPLELQIIAATNRSLKSLVKAGRFRADLLYRLNHRHIVMPPLCERRGDIPVLANHFLGICGAENRRPGPCRFDQGALDKLQQASWRGNCRELKTVIGRLFFECDSDTITEEDVRRQLGDDDPVLNSKPDFTIPLKQRLRDFESTCVVGALDAAGGNVRRAAKLCHEPYGTFHGRLKRLEHSRCTDRAGANRVQDGGRVALPAIPRILFVDDDPLQRRSFARLFRDRFSVELADSGNSALEILDRCDGFDLIVCDYLMDDLDGISVFEHVSRTLPEAAQRFVLVSAYLGHAQVAVRLEKLPCPVIAKPLSEEKIASLLAKSVGVSRVS